MRVDVCIRYSVFLQMQTAAIHLALFASDPHHHSSLVPLPLSYSLAPAPAPAPKFCFPAPSRSQDHVSQDLVAPSGLMSLALAAAGEGIGSGSVSDRGHFMPRPLHESVSRYVALSSSAVRGPACVKPTATVTIVPTPEKGFWEEAKPQAQQAQQAQRKQHRQQQTQPQCATGMEIDSATPLTEKERGRKPPKERLPLPVKPKQPKQPKVAKSKPIQESCSGFAMPHRDVPLSFKKAESGHHSLRMITSADPNWEQRERSLAERFGPEWTSNPSLQFTATELAFSRHFAGLSDLELSMHNVNVDIEMENECCMDCLM